MPSLPGPGTRSLMSSSRAYLQIWLSKRSSPNKQVSSHLSEQIRQSSSVFSFLRGFGLISLHHTVSVLQLELPLSPFFPSFLSSPLVSLSFPFFLSTVSTLSILFLPFPSFPLFPISLSFSLSLSFFFLLRRKRELTIFQKSSTRSRCNCFNRIQLPPCCCYIINTNLMWETSILERSGMGDERDRSS